MRGKEWEDRSREIKRILSGERPDNNCNLLGSQARDQAEIFG